MPHLRRRDHSAVDAAIRPWRAPRLACYDAPLPTRRPTVVAAVLLTVWLAAAAPSLVKQSRRTAAAWTLLSDKDKRERSLLLDRPAFAVGREIARVVPSEGCVVVLAHAGPAAIDYYRSRLRYLLYPRRVYTVEQTSATVASCPFLAVFRDTDQNLAAEPFAGEWRQGELRERTRRLRRLNESAVVAVYGVP